MATPRRIARILASGVLSAALLTGGGVTAVIATAATSAAAATPAPSSAGEISLKASPTEVKAGEKVTFTGRSKGLPIGTKVVL
ncbi:hypothetical protein ACFQ7O_34515 [Streptomyces sp. NPDC056485]